MKPPPQASTPNREDAESKSAFRTPNSAIADPYLQTEKTASNACVRPDGQAEASSLPSFPPVQNSALRAPTASSPNSAIGAPYLQSEKSYVSSTGVPVGDVGASCGQQSALRTPHSAMARPYLQTEKKSETPSQGEGVASAISVPSVVRDFSPVQNSAPRNPHSAMAGPYLQTEKTASNACAEPNKKADDGSGRGSQSAIREDAESKSALPTPQCQPRTSKPKKIHRAILLRRLLCLQ